MLLLGSYLFFIGGITVSDVERPYHILTALILALPVVLVIVWLVAANFSYNSKKRLVKKFISEFKLGDPFWDYDKMLKLSETIFRSVQIAWHNNDFKTINNYLTDAMRNDFNEVWKSLKTQHQKFVFKSILIERVNIIGIEDHPGKNDDNFTVEISGRIIRYLMNVDSGKVLNNDTNAIKRFTDLYQFKRVEDEWRLDKIKYDADITETLGHDIIDKGEDNIKTP